MDSVLPELEYYSHFPFLTQSLLLQKLKSQRTQRNLRALYGYIKYANRIKMNPQNWKNLVFQVFSMISEKSNDCIPINRRVRMISDIFSMAISIDDAKITNIIEQLIELTRGMSSLQIREHPIDNQTRQLFKNSLHKFFMTILNKNQLTSTQIQLLSRHCQNEYTVSTLTTWHEFFLRLKLLLNQNEDPLRIKSEVQIWLATAIHNKDATIKWISLSVLIQYVSGKVEQNYESSTLQVLAEKVINQTIKQIIPLTITKGDENSLLFMIRWNTVFSLFCLSQCFHALFAKSKESFLKLLSSIIEQYSSVINIGTYSQAHEKMVKFYYELHYMRQVLKNGEFSIGSMELSLEILKKKEISSNSEINEELKEMLQKEDSSLFQVYLLLEAGMKTNVNFLKEAPLTFSMLYRVVTEYWANDSYMLLIGLQKGVSIFKNSLMHPQSNLRTGNSMAQLHRTISFVQLCYRTLSKQKQSVFLCKVCERLKYGIRCFECKCLCLPFANNKALRFEKEANKGWKEFIGIYQQFRQSRKINSVPEYLRGDLEVVLSRIVF